MYRGNGMVDILAFNLSSSWVLKSTQKYKYQAAIMEDSLMDGARETLEQG
ncbi:UNVERIFIED_CONTAM: hypothetical protein NCL1_08691 [Trichonephila clavipes]